MSRTVTHAKSEVFLNVYDLSPDNNYLYKIGFGAYHSGLEINGVEYTFGQDGVVSHPPKGAEVDGQCKFRERISLGEISLPSKKIEDHLYNLKEQFPGNSYHVIHKNCNHFTEAFSRALFKKSVQPTWVNRSANFGRRISWIFGKKQEEVVIKHDWEPFQGSGRTLASKDVEVKETKRSSWLGFGKSGENEKCEVVVETTKTTTESVSREQLLSIHEARLKKLQGGKK